MVQLIQGNFKQFVSLSYSRCVYLQKNFFFRPATTGIFIQVQNPNNSTTTTTSTTATAAAAAAASANTTMTELIHVAKKSFEEVTPARSFFNSVAAQVETANLSFERFSALQMKILSAVHESISQQLTEDQQTQYTVTVM